MGEFAVLNNDLNFLSEAGTIAGDASVFVDAVNITTGGFFQPLVNNTNGTIGGDADVEVDVTDDISVGAETFFNILNSNGTIGGSALSDLFASNFSSGSTFEFQILNDGGSIGGDASLYAALSDALTVSDDATIQIGNAGGSIGGDATIDINLGSFSANSLLLQIDNLGGTIGGASSIFFNVDGELASNGDATFQILQDDANASSASISLDVGSYAIGGSLIAKISDGETSFSYDSVSVDAIDDIIVGDQILVDGNLTAGGNISAVNGITIGGGSIIAGGDLTSSAGSISQDFNASQFGDITVTGDINAAGGLFTSGDPVVVSAGGSVFAPGIITGELIAGNNVTVDNTAGGFSFGLIANSTTANGTLFMINSPTITPDNGSSDGTIGFTPHDFFLTVSSIVSTGPTFPLLFSNGSDAEPTVGNDNPGNGGNVTLNLTGGGLTIGSANDLTGIDANGGMFAADSTLGGNGGTVDITATGDVNLLDGDIRATSGFVPDSFVFLGDGGTVNITTSGAISVNSSIEVSSDNVEGNPPVRFSASGGNISLTSTKASAGPAITLTDSGQLLALLDFDAPGPGGSITLLASGNGGSSVDVNGFAEADRGTIDIRHTGTNGMVNLSDATGTHSVGLFADVVKVGALGSNGVLTIGQGFITANDTLKLYGASANGQVHFVDNVTIGGQIATIIAGNRVTVDNNVTVTVNGQFPADVYVGFTGSIPNADYNATQGGNGSTNGVFGGAGVNLPQPIGNAPPFDDPIAPQGPATGSTISATTSAPIPTVEPASPGDRGPATHVIIPRGKQPVPVARVADSNELLALVDKVTSAPTATEPGGSNATTGKTSRGASSVSLGRSRAAVQNLDRANMTLNRSGARRPAALP